MQHAQGCGYRAASHWFDRRRGKKSSEESQDHFGLRDLGRLLGGGVFGTVNNLVCWKNPYGEGIGDKAGKVN